MYFKNKDINRLNIEDGKMVDHDNTNKKKIWVVY